MSDYRTALSVSEFQEDYKEFEEKSKNLTEEDMIDICNHVNKLKYYLNFFRDQDVPMNREQQLIFNTLTSTMNSLMEIVPDSPSYYNY